MVSSKRKWVSVLVVCLLMLSAVLTACSGSKSGGDTQGGTSGDGGQSNQNNNKPINLTIWTGWADLDPWFNKMAEEYKKEHPNVTIEVSSFPLRDYEKKVAAALPARNAADILPMNPNLALRYIGTNLLQPVPDDLAKYVNDTNVHPQAFIDTANVNGKTYSVPAFFGAGAIFYNKDYLKEANLDRPPQDVTEFLDYARKLAKYDASGNLVRAGQSLRLSGGGSGVGEKFWNILAQRGGSIVKEVSPGKYKANYNTPEGVETLKMYVDMVHKYRTDDPKLKHDTEAFQTGVAAFYIRESNVIMDTAKKAPNLNYGTAPLKANVVSLINFYVSSTDKDKQDAAWDFIRFLTKPENHKQLIETSGWLAARTDLDLKDLYAKYPQFEAFYTKQEYQLYPPIPEFDEILTKFADRLANRGFVDPSFVDNPDKIKAFLDEAAKETNDILKQNGHLAE